MKTRKGAAAVKAKPTFARLDVFTKGVIWGMHLAGMGRTAMLKHLEKKDGTAAKLRCVDGVIVVAPKLPHVCATAKDHNNKKGRSARVFGACVNR